MVTARFACCVVVPDALALFGVVGSGVLLLTVAVFVIVVPGGVDAGTCATSVMVDDPGARVAMVQLIVPVQLQPGALTDWNVSPGGRGSASATSDASFGPLLTTEIVYVTSV